MKQVRKDSHTTPQHGREKLNKSLVNKVMSTYASHFQICGYCGFYHHEMYVCSCGWEEMYLEDEEGKLVKEEGNLVKAWTKRT